MVDTCDPISGSNHRLGFGGREELARRYFYQRSWESLYQRICSVCGCGGGDVQRQRDIAAVQTVKEKGLNVDEVPEDLMNALTKDYTEILQKSEEITKNRRGA